MHADHARDDELDPGQADAVGRQDAEAERLARGSPTFSMTCVARAGRLVEIDGPPLEGHGRPGRRDRRSPSAQHTVTVSPSGIELGALLGADDARDAELAAHDGGVAGAAAAIGDDRRRLLHDRLPVGIGHAARRAPRRAASRRDPRGSAEAPRAPDRRSADRSPCRTRAARPAVASEREHLDQRPALGPVHRLRAAPGQCRGARPRRRAPTRCPSASAGRPRRVVGLDREPETRQLQHLVVGQA